MTMDIPTNLPCVLNQLILTYLRYADYSDEEIRKFFPADTVIIWRRESNVNIENGTANGVLHCVDDRPIITLGSQLWFRNGEYHRDNDLPAYINGDVRIWYKNGEKHRDSDKPAVVRSSSSQRPKEHLGWYIDGKCYRDNIYHPVDD